MFSNNNKPNKPPKQFLLGKLVHHDMLVSSHDSDIFYSLLQYNIPDSDILEYYSILSSLGLAPSRLCPYRPALSQACPSKDFFTGRVPHVQNLGPLSPLNSTHEYHQATGTHVQNSMDLRVQGSTHGGRALWVNPLRGKPQEKAGPQGQSLEGASPKEDNIE